MIPSLTQPNGELVQAEIARRKNLSNSYKCKSAFSRANLYVLIVVVFMAKRYGIQQASIEDKSTNAMTSLTRVIQNAKHLQLLKMMSLQSSLKHTQRSWVIIVR